MLSSKAQCGNGHPNVAFFPCRLHFYSIVDEVEILDNELLMEELCVLYMSKTKFRCKGLYSTLTHL